MLGQQLWQLARINEQLDAAGDPRLPLDEPCLLEVTVPDREHYQAFPLGKLLDLPIVKEVRSHIAIQSLKTSAPRPLGHLGSAMPSSR